MKKVAVVILNWNGKKLLEQFMPSVIKNTNTELADVVIADNASSDESISFLESNYPEISIIQLDKNYGFAEGYNKALKQLSNKYYVLLNSDVEVSENWLEPLFELMESDKKIAAIQPKIKSLQQKDHFEHAGAAGGFIDYLGYPFCRGRLLDKIEEDKGQYDTIREIFWASGAALFVRAEQYHAAGGLDKDFFAHMEEIDLCWRLKNRGFRILCNPESTVYHLGGGTLSNHSSRKLYLNFRNNLLMMYKNLPKGKALKILFIRMILDGLAAIKFLLELKISSFFAVIKAHISFYGKFKIFRKKRTQLLPSIKQANHREIYNKSIIVRYFLKKQKYFSELNF